MGEDADNIIRDMKARREFMGENDTTNIVELIEYIEKYLNKKLEIVDNLMLYPFQIQIEDEISENFGISVDLAKICAQIWTQKYLGDYYGVRWSDGYEIWTKNKNKHRDDDLPALVNPKDSGTKLEWWCEGMRHREDDKPAVIYDSETESGRKEWWYKGLLHRTGGKPAIIDGETIQYYLYGVEVNEHVAKLF